MNKYLAKGLSVIAHPVFINLLCLYILFDFFPQLSAGLPLKVQLFYVGFIFVLSSLVPLILVLAMRLTGKIESIHLQHKQERNLPYFFTLIMYVFIFFNFYKSASTSPFILSYLLACMLILFSVFIVNYFTKISIHLATLGAAAGLMASAGFFGFLDVRYLLILFIIFSGMVATARLSLNAHIPNQIYVGFCLGFVCMFLCMNMSYLFLIF